MNKIPKKKDRPGVDHYGRNDLINHVRANDLKNVQVFINSGIDINQCADNKWTALHFACQNVSEKMIELLLKNGANPNVRDIDGNTPLSKALFNIRDMDSIAIQ